MRLSAVVAAAATACGVVGNAVSPAIPNDLPVEPRALPNSPKGYTPSQINCPSIRPTVRSASSLSNGETQWLPQRRKHSLDSMRSLLQKIDISDFNAAQYLDKYSQNASALPNIGIAMSGGGWRALQSGAGAVQAFDSRSNSGKLGGLLQSATYLAGLSGGGWLVSSIYMNNFTTVTALRDDTSGTVWEFGNSILEGPDTGGLQAVDTIKYWDYLLDDVDGKADAGYDVTLTDLWGRALSYQLINAPDGGPAFTFSSIALSTNFQNGQVPFPILIADERSPNQLDIASNTTIYEFNPFEMGSWDPTTYGFIPTKYLGTNFTAGIIPGGDQCTIGFDNAGFILGTSSSLFNQILLQVNSTGLPSAVQKLLDKTIDALGINNEDIAVYRPNPFFHYNPSTNPSAGNTSLTLVDGGEDNQNLPIHPLIQPARNVDVIFAVDSSADTTYHWPNGSALVQTYQRNLPDVSISNGTRFPYIPDTNTFINLGLNTRPTFFGCNASNVTSANGHEVPLVVYIPNAPYVSYSNISTFQLTTNDSYRDAIILNGFDVATMGNGTLDPDWPTCVGCAILSRSLYRTGTTVPDACTQCFNKFCWDGTLNATLPRQYEPTLKLKGVSTSSNDSPPTIAKRSSNWRPLGLLAAVAAWHF